MTDKPGPAAKPGRKGKEMEIKSGMYFRGDMNGKTVRIINASDKLITFDDVDNGKIFTVGRSMFEHCYLTRL